MKLMYLQIVLLIATQIACATSAMTALDVTAPGTATIEPSQPTAMIPTSAPACYTVTAEEGLHVRALPKFDSPIVGILTAGQGITATNENRDIHGNRWLFVGDGWSRADWLIETECK